MEKLDLKDKKLLKALFRDARTTNKQLAKNLRISKETVQYRIKRLEKKNIIKGYVPVIDHAQLGATMYKITMKLNDKEEKNKIIEYLRKIPQTSWVVKMRSQWDIVVIFWIQDQRALENIYDGLMKEHGQKIRDRRLSIVEKIYHKSPDYIHKDMKTIFVTGSGKDNHSLDENQNKVMQLLLKDARASLLGMAKELGLSVSTVKYHKELLEKRKIIIGYRVVIDEQLLDMEHFKVVVELMNPQEKDKMRELFLTHDNVVYVTKSIGKYDIEFEAEFPRTDDLLTFIEETDKKIKIKEYEIRYIEEELLINSIPT